MFRVPVFKKLPPWFIAVSISLIIFAFGYILIAPTEADDTKTFRFSSSTKGGPVFEFASVDPSHVKVGDLQEFKVRVSDSSGVVSVIATTQLDTQKRDVALHPEDGAESCVDCVWSGSWEVNDTSDKTYETTIVATNQLGRKKSVTISWTDPCSPPVVGSWTLDDNCAIADTQGLEEGTFYIPQDKTLTILNGGTWVYQKGHPISIYGTIAIEDGGKMVRSLLWAPDNDNDGFSTSVAAQVTSTMQPSEGYVRRKTLSGFGDCYDANANVKPGQTSYFVAHRGDGSYDYDCSGGEEKMYPTYSSGSCVYYGKAGYYSTPGWSPAGIPSCGETRTYYTMSGYSGSCPSENRTQKCR